MTDNIHKSWEKLFDCYEFNLDDDINVFPEKKDIFKVFEMDVKDIKVVFLGQDCYIKKGQAHGLSFSVPKGVDIPPSLRNIYTELKNEFPERKYDFKHGNLEKWFKKEKIFLLNCALTVKAGQSGSNMDMWEEFTNETIEYISNVNEKCVFLLLGNFAKSKEKFIKNKNMIVKGVHPSPLSAHAGFFNSDIFKKVESIVGKIDWNI